MSEMPLIEQVKATGLRETQQRQCVCDFLDRTNDHHDAKELFKAINQTDRLLISRRAVYRILGELENHGLIQRVNFKDQRARYEKASRNHDHLIDQKNGEVVAFVDPKVESKMQQIASKRGCELVDYALALFVVLRSERSKTTRPSVARKL